MIILRRLWVQIQAAQGKLDIAKQTLKQAVDKLEALRDQVAGQETSAQLFFENKLGSYALRLRNC